ncbi:MAG: atpB [Chitinophagaceae bacterium]|nr:atpB [Chitinophagaceae bacterium]
MATKIHKLLLTTTLALVVLFTNSKAFANDAAASTEEAFNPGEMIQHHITDAPDWHILTIDGHDYSIPLPVILYSSQRGLDVFSSSRFEHGHVAYNGYKLEHGHIEAVDASGAADHSVHLYNVSITKNVASMMLSAVLLLVLFLTIANSYKKRQGLAPKGAQSFFEPIILYIRDDVAKTMIGPKYEKFMPYLLTIFFFIWFNNLLGLIPAGANVSGNITFTLFLALATFLITTLTANKYYWAHILWTPGVPLPLRIIILPLEVIGMFTKPFSLMIRLFANITAGHIIVLSFLGLVFIFKTIAVAAFGVPFALFISVLELFVAILQAYVFTLLTALYFGSAVHAHEHDDDHAQGHEAAH